MVQRDGRLLVWLYGNLGSATEKLDEDHIHMRKFDIYSPPQEVVRITYFQGCGDLRYLDVEELVLGGARELQELLKAEARAVRHHSQQATQADPSSGLPAPPPQAHLQATGRQGGHSQNQGLGQGVPSHTPTGTSARTVGPVHQVLSPPNRLGDTKYLILCVNTKRGLVTPEHLDVSSISNDQYLFEQVNTAYTN